jgi:hypothetical protein
MSHHEEKHKCHGCKDMLGAEFFRKRDLKKLGTDYWHEVLCQYCRGTRCKGCHKYIRGNGLLEPCMCLKCDIKHCGRVLGKDGFCPTHGTKCVGCSKVHNSELENSACEECIAKGEVVKCGNCRCRAGYHPQNGFCTACSPYCKFCEKQFKRDPENPEKQKCSDDCVIYLLHFAWIGAEYKYKEETRRANKFLARWKKRENARKEIVESAKTVAETAEAAAKQAKVELEQAEVALKEAKALLKMQEIQEIKHLPSEMLKIIAGYSIE